VTELLILGGTAEARALAERLATVPGMRVTSSLAGRVQNPALPFGEVRIGGFGGVAGLIDYLRGGASQARFDAVVDATHPFAAQISANAVEACQNLVLPLCVLRRPAWTASQGDRWEQVGSVAGAAAAITRPGSVLLTTGRRDLDAFCFDTDRHYVVRTVDPPAPPLPESHVVVLDRGPYTLAGELALMRRERIQTLVTKNSGGEHTRAKLDAARLLDLHVIMVQQPVPALGSPPPVADVDAATVWCHSLPPPKTA